MNAHSSLQSDLERGHSVRVDGGHAEQSVRGKVDRNESLVLESQETLVA